MWLDLGCMSLFLLIGNILFRHFDPWMPWWRRVLKSLLILAITALISYYFGHRGFLIAFGLALIPLLYIHGIWLPRRGINGLTAKPRDKYYALRGWPPPDA